MHRFAFPVRIKIIIAVCPMCPIFTELSKKKKKKNNCISFLLIFLSIVSNYDLKGNIMCVFISFPVKCIISHFRSESKHRLN